MKALALFLLTTSAFASQLELVDYDQAKLAHFLGKLPSSVVDKSEEKDSRKVRITFPRKAEAFQIKCVSEYFDSAPVPSDSKCTVEIDLNHQSLEKNYDEVRMKDDSAETARAFFAIMPHGKDPKSFRSGEWEEGTDFNGRRTNIFTYLFECSQTSCLYRFSEKMIK